MKGVIALDIDGTSAQKGKAIHPALSAYLEKLSLQGWVIYFVTGRMLSFAKKAFDTLNFPFYLALQNGADIIEYPSKKLLYRSYIASNVSLKMDERCPFVIYSGFERGDFCYYVPGKFSKKERAYLDKLKKVGGEEWVALDSFEDEKLQKEVPLIKGFGTLESLENVEKMLADYSTSTIEDTVDPSLYIMLVTSKEADKGIAIDHLRQRLKIPKSAPTIVAGDDRNDIPMLKKADIAIVINHAPKELHPLATFFAEPPEKDGLIEALKQVIDEKGNYSGT